MNRRTTVLAGTLAVLLGASVAHGQRARPRTASIPASPPAEQAAPRPRNENPPPAPPSSSPAPAPQAHAARIAGIAPPPAPAPPPVTSTVFGAPQIFAAPVHVMQLYYIPTVVLNDGRVLANFGTGRGYEQVLRQCPQLSGTLPPNFAVSPCFIVDAYGRYSVLQQR